MQDNIVLSPIPLDELLRLLTKNVIDGLKSLPTTTPPAPTGSTGSDVLRSRKEVAAMFGITYPTLNEWTKKGIITAHRVSTRVYYKQSDIENALSKVKAVKS